MYEDKTLVCQECGKEFIFSAKEQEFYAEKGFANEPKRCSDCRRARKNNRERFTITCAKCGKEDSIPFKPFEGKEYFCKECYATMKTESEATPVAKTPVSELSDEDPV